MQSDIKIKLKFRCIIGLLDFERVKKQKVIVKIRAKSSEFLDYAALIKLVKKAYKKNEFKTIEESFEVIFSLLKANFKELYYLKIKTYKPNIIKNAKVGARAKFIA